MCKNTISVQVSDVEMGDAEDRHVELPAVWSICGTCRGNGQHSLGVGAITADEWHNDWSSEEQDDYLSGMYDRACAPCDGTGKLLVIDRVACQRDDKLRAALAKHDDDEAIDEEIEAMHRAEIAFGC